MRCADIFTDFVIMTRTQLRRLSLAEFPRAVRLRPDGSRPFCRAIHAPSEDCSQSNVNERKESTPMFINRITLAGFVGADARHSATQKGKEITRFSLATSKRHREGEQRKEKTQWHECVIYGGSMKHSEDAIQKGAHLLVEGELAYRKYDRTIETDGGPIKIK